MAFSRQFNRVLTAAALVLALAVASGAFAIGFTASLSDSLESPSSVQALRLAALDRLDAALGSNGFLRAYRDALPSPEMARDALLRFDAAAQASLGAFAAASLTESDRKDVAAMRALIVPFQIARDPKMPLPALFELDRAYTGLKARMADAAATANRQRIERLTGSLQASQALSVFLLVIIATVLFVLAMFLRSRVVAPLEQLRGSVNAAAASGMGETVFGVTRDDEIGGVARAVERLRQAGLAARKDSTSEAASLLAKGAERLESDLARVADVALEAQNQIEAASARAAAASQVAVEAADLAREGSTRFAQRAEDTLEFTAVQTNAVLGAVMNAVARLSDAAARLETASPAAIAVPEDVPAPLLRKLRETSGSAEISPFPAPDKDEAIIEDLIADLDALERFATERKDIAGNKAVAMTASLIEAIDRLNTVADRISASADKTELRAAS